MFRLFFIVCLHAVVCPTIICAQQKNYVFQHLTTRDGLSSNYIQSIFQDSKGFYWIGTTSGLQIFDGYNFSQPITAGKDVLSIPYITETKDGTIWVSSASSLYRYSRAANRLIPVTSNTYKPRKTIRVLEDSSGGIWISNSVELYKYNYENETLLEWLKIPLPDFSKTICSIAKNKNENAIWFQNEKKLYKIVPGNKTLTEETTFPYQSSLIWADGQYLWVAFWEQYVCRYNTRTRQKDWFRLPIKLKDSNSSDYGVPVCFARDQRGRLWIGGEGGGLWYFRDVDFDFVQIETDNMKPGSFHYNEVVYAMQVDKEGNFWIGSDRGLNIFNPFYQHFYTINNTDLPTKFISSVASQKLFETSKGDVLIGTEYGGWFQCDSHFKLKKNFSVQLNSSSSYIDSCKTVVKCFAEDKDGRIWIGHRGGVLGIYDPVTGNIKYQRISEFKKSTITSIQCDAIGNMWFSFRDSSNSLIKWDKSAKQYKAYNDSRLKKSEPHQSSILITKQGDIWVQTFGNGVYRFDPVKEKISEIYRDDLPPYKIPTAVQHISSLNDSIVAIASFAEGFFLVNTNNKTCAHLGTGDGLPSNLAKAIVTDSRHNYWVTMLSDLVRMDPRTKQIVSFDEEDGVLNKSFYPGCTRLRDGRLIVLSSTGLLYFYPDSIKFQSPPPDVLITGLQISSKAVLFDSILNANNNKIPLAYDQNFLTIEYVSISYLNRKKNTYFYKLQGLDKDWIQAGTDRNANYTNLNPGKYTFFVRCRNRDGIFSKHTTTLTFIISPPWWRTWWAYCLYALLCGGLVYALYRNQIESMRKVQQSQIKAMVATQEEERKRISRDLHDEVGTKLSALKLFVSSLHEKATNVNNEEIKSLAKSSEQFITEAMQEVRQLLLNLSPTVLEEFGYTIAVEGLINKINETKQIAFTLVVFGMTHRMQKDYELALYRITQELVNNVLKHSAAKNVSLQIGQRDEKIILMIEDDGKGFEVNAHRDGYGLHNLDARTRLMHGTINIDSQPGKGTSVLIEIPYNFNGV